MSRGYSVDKPRDGWRDRHSFLPAERAKLRPIAETLAMLDGNAFFGLETREDNDDIWFEQYLPEAHALYESNGGDGGYAGLASFVKAAK